MKIRIINKSKHKLPAYSTESSAGIDLRANIEEKIVQKPMQRVTDLSEEIFVIEVGDRICQMIISRQEQAELVSVDTIQETEKGEGGFGYTGKKQV